MEAGNIEQNLVDIQREQEPGVIADNSLALDLPDDELNFYLDTTIRESRSYYENTMKWWQKMEQAENIWLGNQIDEEQLYEWQKPAYVDNVIFRNIETIIPIAVARLPEPQVEPSQPRESSRQLASDLEKHLVYHFKKENMRSKFRLAVRHLLIYKLGVIKWLWDPNRGPNGDYTFKVIRPTKFYALDHTTADPYGQRVVVEIVSEPAKLIAAKFPKKKEEFYQQVGIRSKAMEDAIVNYEEIHFTWYDESGSPQEALLWRYKHIILDSMKTPNWDWKGEPRESYDEFENLISEQAFANFFEKPRKPYVWFSYLGLGKQLVDDTSLLEQSWPLNQLINRRGMQITDMADRAQGKMVVSNDFLPEEEAEKITSDPNEHISGTGDVRSGFTYFPGTPPHQSLFEDINRNASEIDNLMGSHSTTRGERKEQETLGGRVLLREADYGRIDDLVQEAVEPAAKACFEAAMHLIKLRYTEPHYAKVSGENGKFDLLEFSRDSVEDGMEAEVATGSTLPIDRMFRRNEAVELASSGMITPDVLFEKLGWSNPKEEALKLMVFNMDKNLYMQILSSGQDFTDAVANLQAMQAQAPAPGMPPAPGAEQVPPGQMPIGQPAPEPGGEDAQGAAAAMARMREFAMSPDYQNLTDEQKQQFVQQMRSLVQQSKMAMGG